MLTTYLRKLVDVHEGGNDDPDMLTFKLPKYNRCTARQLVMADFLKNLTILKFHMTSW